MFFSPAKLPAEQPKFKINVFFFKILSAARGFVFFGGNIARKFEYIHPAELPEEKCFFLGCLLLQRGRAVFFFLASWPGNLNLFINLVKQVLQST